MSRPAALAFDAYGTLFDVHSVVALCDELWPGQGVALSQLWRAKQLEYTWLRTLMHRYEDFAQITESALHYACGALGLEFDRAKLGRLLQAYVHLQPFPEVKGTLAALGGKRLAILSNGSPGMLAPLVANAGLDGLISEVLSVHELGVYKPDPRVYQLAVERLGVPANAIGFVSSNGWDALGAKSFGFTVFWVNRSAAPLDRLGFTPDYTLATLADLPALVAY
jgi:2-haloacid dehalogenase